MIRKIGIGCALIAALALPTGASAERSPSNSKNAAKYCKALRDKMSRDDFRAEFGSNRNRRNAFGKCVSRQRKAERRLVAAATRECKAELAADPVAFMQKYGADSEAEASGDHPGERPERDNGPDKGERPGDEGENPVREAFRRCIRSKVKQMTAERREAVRNAAQECKAEYRDDHDAFRERYGSNRNKRNAFGKCVLEHLADDTDTEA